MTTTIIRPAPVGIGGQVFGTFETGALHWDSSIVGGDDTWADDDDATYTRNGYDVVGGDAPVDVGFAPCVLPGVDPAQITDISVTVRAMFESGFSNTIQVELVNGGVSGATPAMWGDAVPGDDPLDVGSIITLTRTAAETAIALGADPELSLADAASTLTTAGTDLWVVHAGIPDDGVIFLRVYEVALTVTYGESATLIAVTRQFPRDDALGLGSAPRIHPPPKGGRIAGGYQ